MSNTAHRIQKAKEEVQKHPDKCDCPNIIACDMRKRDAIKALRDRLGRLR